MVETRLAVSQDKRLLALAIPLFLFPYNCIALSIAQWAFTKKLGPDSVKDM